MVKTDDRSCGSEGSRRQGARFGLRVAPGPGGMKLWVRGGLSGLAVYLLLTLAFVLPGIRPGWGPLGLVPPGEFLASFCYTVIGDPDDPRHVLALGLFLGGAFWAFAGALVAGLFTEETRKTALVLFGTTVALAFGLLVVIASGARPGKAKTSEARSNLGAIRATQVAYFAEWGVYVGSQPPTPLADRRAHPERMKWDPDTRFSILGFAPEGKVWFSYSLEGPAWSKEGFTAHAECDLDGDGLVSVYTTVNASSAVLHSGAPF